MGKLIAALLVSAGLLLGVVPVALAASAGFGTPTATATFGKEIVFTQPVTLGEAIGSAEILVTFPGSAGPTVFEVPAPPGTGATELRYTFDIATDGHVAPNTRLTARWRLYPVAAPKAAIVSPPVSILYADDRFTWQTETGSLVRVHWYQGDATFGARALKIGEDAVESASKLLGVTETEPIDFFVYADQSAFYDALGPGTRENVGGQANTEIRTMFALVTPDEIDQSWVGIVIPHELTHLVFDTAVSNPYHFPPRWLNEGLAVYESQGYVPSDQATVKAAAASGDLMPLGSLTGQFPTTFDRFGLAYAESVASVDYLVRTYGQDALVSLIKSYATGLTDDEAFTRALGVDATAFGDAWLASVGAVAPTRYGPVTAAPAPSLVAGAAPGSTAPGSTTPGSTGTSASDTGVDSVVLAAIAISITGIAVVGLYARRRRQDSTGT